MTLLKRWLGVGTAQPDLAPLYSRVVAAARRPAFYRDGGVPDTLDGRFDMLAATLALVLLRLEALPDGARPAALLTERFVADMDAQLREAGIGDVVVGKQVGRMMAALGGRLAAYRDALAPGAPLATLDEALARNLYRGAPPESARVEVVSAALRALHRQLGGRSLGDLLEGRL